MAQRNTPPASTGGGKASSGGPARKSTGPVSTSKSGAKSGAGKPGATKPGGGKPGTKPNANRPAGRPPARKSGKSIVNQKQTPWGLIWTTVAVVAFAAAVVVAVVVSGGNSTSSSSASNGGQSVDASDPYRQPELAAASKISGLTYRVEGEHNHETGSIKYDASPPIGGNHNGFWADCAGTVYSKAIANENAVHMLEHGGIWITYNADKVTGADLTTLKSYVSGINGMALSPYPNLKSAVSLQAWGYQLFVDKVNDPRIQQFISLLKFNKKTTPEYGASCANPAFKEHPSTFGHPVDS